MTHGEQSDFVIEINEALDNATAHAGTAAGLGFVPSSVDVGFASYRALAFS